MKKSIRTLTERFVSADADERFALAEMLADSGGEIALHRLMRKRGITVHAPNGPDASDNRDEPTLYDAAWSAIHDYRSRTQMSVQALAANETTTATNDALRVLARQADPSALPALLSARDNPNIRCSEELLSEALRASGLPQAWKWPDQPVRQPNWNVYMYMGLLWLAVQSLDSATGGTSSQLALTSALAVATFQRLGHLERYSRTFMLPPGRSIKRDALPEILLPLGFFVVPIPIAALNMMLLEVLTIGTPYQVVNRQFSRKWFRRVAFLTVLALNAAAVVIRLSQPASP